MIRYIIKSRRARRIGKRMIRNLAVGMACASGLSLSPADARAREAGAPDRELMVTGQRQAYRGLVPITDIPQSITLLNEERLEEGQITRLADALDLSSSVARQNNFGGLWESFAIRGLVGDENNPSGYLVNGFNAGRGFAGPRDISGIERIEILKGPNAALFGRGEPGGGINLVTKRPTGTFAAKLEGSYGSYDFRRVEGDMNLPATDFAAVRFVGFYEAADSFRDTIKTERYGIFPSVLFRFGPSTSLIYELEATRQEVPLDRGVFALGDNLKTVPRSRFLGEPGLGPNVATATGHQFSLQHDFSADWSLLVGIGLRDTELKGSSADAELAAPRQRLFVDGRSLTREVRYREYDGDHRVFRGELSGRFDSRFGLHHVIVGADRDIFESDLFVLGYRAPLLSTSPTAQQGFEIDILEPVYGRFPVPTLNLPRLRCACARDRAGHASAADVARCQSQAGRWWQVSCAGNGRDACGAAGDDRLRLDRGAARRPGPADADDRGRLFRVSGVVGHRHSACFGPGSAEPRCLARARRAVGGSGRAVAARCARRCKCRHPAREPVADRRCDRARPPADGRQP
ncbi:outer membrane receptor protein involved in Fe transport [Sphingopyxis sp. JAI128]|nr:outer membrane receptor protein involved in Fe transport [Sphingopyxis sp. JAI128]